MNDQRHDQHTIAPEQDKQKRDLPGAGQHEKQELGTGHKPRHSEQKPKTEQSSHQGGGGVRSDHQPQGPGASTPHK